MAAIRQVANKPLDDRWPDRFAAVTYAFAAFVFVIAVVPPWHRYFAREDDALSLVTIPIVPSLVYAALLFVLGVALRRRIRIAWWILVIWWLMLPQIGRVIAIADGEDLWANSIGFVLITAVLVLAVRVRAQFTAHRVAGQSAGRSSLLPHRRGRSSSSPAPPWSTDTARLRTSARRPSSSCTRCWVRSAAIADDSGGHRAAVGPGLIGIAGAAVVLVLRASCCSGRRRTPAPRQPADEARVRTLLREFGDTDSLGYFATRRDKSIVWDTGDAATARAGVSYRAIGSVSLASGNPVGDPLRWDAAIERWRDQARASGWSLAVMGAGEAGAQAFAKAGLTAFEIGDEAIVNMREFSLAGPGMKAVRQSVSRLQRRGYTTNVIRHETLTADDFAALSDAAGQWRGDGGDERGFSMALGRLEDPLDGQCMLVQAFDAEGAAARIPELRALGPQRTVARPDAARSHRRQRPDRADGRGAGRALGDLRGRAGLVELRDVPRGVRARGADRRRPGVAAVAAGAAAGEPQLAARVALSLQREVPARLAAALHVLRVHLRPSPRRHRGRKRRGLLDQAVAVDAAQARSATMTRRSVEPARSTPQPSQR